MNNKVYDVIADRIMTMLDAGVVPWRKPWVGGSAGMPKNGASKKAYRGINIFMLHAAGYANPNWFTFNQAKEIGASVRKGEKGMPVVFWKMQVFTDDKAGELGESGEAKDKKVPLLRYYTVFNAEQLDNLPLRFQLPAVAGFEHGAIEAAEKIVADMPRRPALCLTGSRAFYRPSEDAVTVPPLSAFPVASEYYSTMFHELAHSTMHETRLNRKNQKHAAFGSDDYGREELLAEFGASFLCGIAGIETATIENAAAYIANWKAAIKADSSIVVMAAAQAQKAADFILGVVYSDESDKTPAASVCDSSTRRGNGAGSSCMLPGIEWGVL